MRTSSTYQLLNASLKEKRDWSFEVEFIQYGFQPQSSQLYYTIHCYMKLITISCLFLHLTVSAVTLGPPLCTDWYNSTLACQKYQKKLQNDTGQNLCGSLIAKYKQDKKKLGELIKISYCLQHIAHKSKINQYQDSLFQKMSGDEAWYFNTLKNLRIRKDLAVAIDLAYLCERKFPNSGLIRTELSEIYLLNSDFISAGSSYLKALNGNRASYNSTRYQLTNLLRVASIEFTPQQLLDSLINSTASAKAVSLQILGELSLQNKNYKGALACYAGRNKLGDIKWIDVKKADAKIYKRRNF